MTGLALTLALVVGQVPPVVPGGVEESFGGAFSFGGDGFGAAGSAGVPVLYAPLSTTGPLLPEDSGTVSHVYWDGSALQDTVGNSWSMNGTVPQTAANVSPFVPGKAGAGPYSAANNYQGSTSLMEWAPGSDWSVTVVWKQTSFGGTASHLAAKGTTTSGWFIQISSAGAAYCVDYDGTQDVAIAAGTVVLNAVNVLTCGRSGGSIYARLNGGTSGTTVSGTMIAASSEPARIGRYGTAGNEAINHTIYEILASTTPYSDALHLARYQRVFGMLTQQGQAISVTRATDETYTANGLVWSTPNDTLSTGTDGAEVWKAATNNVAISTSFCTTGDVVQPGWSLFGATCTNDTDTGPDGRPADTVTKSAASGSVYVAAASIASTTTMTMQGYFKHVSGATKGGFLLRCAAAPTSCTCTGTGCVAQVVSTDCQSEFTTSASEWRLHSLSATCPAAITSVTFAGYPGGINADSGSATKIADMQLETGLYATPYIYTNGATATRNAVVATTPLPDLGNKWCISVTAMPATSTPWNLTTSGRYLWSNYVGATTNAFNLLTTGTTLFFNVYDSGGAAKTKTYVHGLSGVTAARLTACNNGGVQSLCINGVSGGTNSGAGTGLQSATLTPIYLGSQNGASQWDGSLSNLRICKGATKCGDCR